MALRIMFALALMGFYFNPVNVISSENGVVISQDTKGNIWECEGEPVGIYLMFSNFTEDITDDIIIGGFKYDN